MSTPPRPGVRARSRGFLKRRLSDLGLAVAWLVVLFNLIQVLRIDGETTTRIVVSVTALLAIGVAATVLWVRGRRA